MLASFVIGFACLMGIFFYFRTVPSSQVTFSIHMKRIAFQPPQVHCADYVILQRVNTTVVVGTCNDNFGKNIWNENPTMFTTIHYLHIRFRMVSGGKFWVLIQGKLLCQLIILFIDMRFWLFSIIPSLFLSMLSAFKIITTRECG